MLLLSTVLNFKYELNYNILNFQKIKYLKNISFHVQYFHVPEPPADLPPEGAVPLLLHHDDDHSGHGEVYCSPQTILKVLMDKITIIRFS